MADTKKCEHCGGAVNIQYLICPLCGGSLQEKVVPGIPVCPRCGVGLEIQVHDNEEYGICQQCGGMWLDRDDFDSAIRESYVFTKGGIDKSCIKEPVRDLVKYIPCIRCGKLMNRKNFRRISGVIIDECARHGVWLDRGELGKIQLFIAEGGLEKSQDREIEKTKSELRDLATKVDQTAFTQKILHFWNFKRWLFGG